MKKTKVLSIAACMALMAFGLSSCGPKDADIKEAVSTKAASMPEIQESSIEVKDGVVTITGMAPTEEAKAAEVAAIKEVKGVKDVVANVTITPPAPPVMVAQDDPLMMGVKDATKDFPTVNASVNDGVITLTGEIERKKLPTLMASLQGLNPKKVDNQLTVK